MDPPLGAMLSPKGQVLARCFSATACLMACGILTMMQAENSLGSFRDEPKGTFKTENSEIRSWGKCYNWHNLHLSFAPCQIPVSF